MARRPTPIVLQEQPQETAGQALGGLGQLLSTLGGIKEQQNIFKQAGEEFGLTPQESRSLGVDALKQIFLKKELVNLERESELTEAEATARDIEAIKVPAGEGREGPVRAGRLPLEEQDILGALSRLQTRGAITPEAFQRGIGLAKPSELPKFVDFGLTKTLSTELQTDPDILGAEDFFKRPVEFRARKITQAQERITQRNITQAERRGIAGIKAQIASQSDRQISIAALQNVRDPETFEQMAIGTTFREAKAAGSIIATPKQVGEIFDLDRSGFQLDEIDALTTNLITAENAASAALQGAGQTLAAFAKTNPVAATYVSTSKGFLGNLARSMGGEVGVLTEGDITRIGNVLPSLGDTKTIKEMKIIVLKGLHAQAQEVARAKILGQPQGKEARRGWEKTKDAVLSALETGDPEIIRRARNLLKGGPTKVMRFDAQGNLVTEE